MGFRLAATNRCMLGLRVVLLSAPTPLASTTHGDRSAPRRRHICRRSSEAGQREHMVRQDITGSWKLMSFCVLVAISPRRAKLGGRDPRDALGRHTPADPRRWRPAGGPVAGAGLAVCPPAASGMSAITRKKKNSRSSPCVRGEVGVSNLV
jgi:hypothetical protein